MISLPSYSIGAPIRALRALLWAQWTLAILMIPVVALSSFALPPELRSWSESQEVNFGAPEWVALAIVFALGLSGSIGCYRLWRPGRTLYLAAVLGGSAASLYTGPVVATAAEFLLYDLWGMCTGGILAVLYLTPVRDFFASRPPASGVPQAPPAT
jgi:hypothetical protein